MAATTNSPTVAARNQFRYNSNISRMQRALPNKNTSNMNKKLKELSELLIKIEKQLLSFQTNQVNEVPYKDVPKLKILHNQYIKESKKLKKNNSVKKSNIFDQTLANKATTQRYIQTKQVNDTKLANLRNKYGNIIVHDNDKRRLGQEVLFL